MNMIINVQPFVHPLSQGLQCLHKLLSGISAVGTVPATDIAFADALRQVRETTIDDLGLPPKIVQVLERQDILRLDDLVRKSPAQLKQLRGVGDKSIEKVNRALALRGASLRSEYA